MCTTQTRAHIVLLSCWGYVWSTFYVDMTFVYMNSDYCHQYDNTDVYLLYYLTFFQPHLCIHSRQVKGFVQTPARCRPTVLISNRTMWLSLLSQYFQDTPCWNPLGICTQRILNWGALKLGATLYQQSMAGDKRFFLLILDWQMSDAFYPIPRKVPQQWAPDSHSSGQLSDTSIC